MIGGKLKWLAQRKKKFLGSREAHTPASALGRIIEDVSKFQKEEFALYRNELGRAECYGEYGVGASTVFAASFPNLKIVAVETDLEWVRAVGGHVGSRANISHVDLGPIAGFGRPLSYKRVDNFRQYTEGIFRQEVSPDLVLVDGRFRVASFFASLLNARPGTRILFDDYQRARYQIVEEVLQPQERTKRQGLFVKPDDFDLEKARWFFDKFEYVMD